MFVAPVNVSPSECTPYSELYPPTFLPPPPPLLPPLRNAFRIKHLDPKGISRTIKVGTYKQGCI